MAKMANKSGQMIIYGFDYSDWTPFSIRLNSENYMSSDGKYVLKLMSEVITQDLDDIIEDVSKLKLVQEMGLPSPKVSDVVVTNDGKIGYICEYILHKKSIARAIHDEPDRMDEFCGRFSKLAKQLHQTQCLTDCYPDVQEESRNAVLKVDFLTDSEKNYLITELDKLPKVTTCLHGDFQFSNFIVSDGGDYLIDLAFLGYGHPMIDWGFAYLFASVMGEDALDRVFHMDRPTALKAVKYSFMKYLDTNDIKEAEDYLEKALPCGLCLAARHCFVINNQHLKDLIKYTVAKLIKQ